MVLEPARAKRRQILAAARQVFGDLGFERASVDVIAASAGVSKATVYNHFEDKKSLFVACVLEEADEMRAGLEACFGEPKGSVDDALQAIGEQVLGVFLSPAVSGLYRMAIAETVRFPEIGRMLFERGPDVLHDSIASFLRRWNAQGALRIDDARSAAVQFLALCQGDLAVRARLGILGRPAEREVRETVRRAVRTFVRAYEAR